MKMIIFYLILME